MCGVWEAIRLGDQTDGYTEYCHGDGDGKDSGQGQVFQAGGGLFGVRCHLALLGNVLRYVYRLFCVPSFFL